MNIIKEIFNKIDVLYDDKKWGKRIDPNEWNANFKVLEEGHNNLVDKLLSQFSNIDTVIESATENGGTNVKVNYRGGNETLQDTVDNIISDVDNRYTKNETDVKIATSVNPLFSDISYESSTGKFIFTKKDGSSIVIDTVIEKIPASMTLKEEANGSVWLVVTNQDGSTTKTNVTSLIEDTIVTGSDTVNVSSTSDAINKVTTYVLSIKPNSIGLSHVDSELVSKFEETESAKTLAVQAKDNAVSAANSASSSASFAEAYANSANSSEFNSKKSEINAKASETNAKSYMESAYEYAKTSSNKALEANVHATSAEGSASAASTSENNAKDSFTKAFMSAQASQDKAKAASDSALKSEAWSVGTKDGVSVTEEDEQYNNNSKYWAERSQQSASDASISRDESVSAKNSVIEYANSSAENANKSLQYKNDAESAKIAAERARNEAESIVGGNYASIEYVDNKVSGLATEEYVQQNSGKIDSISVNGATQNIDENKNVNISIPNHTLITIPSGRMRGDIDGDGKLTQDDVDLLSAYVFDPSTTPLDDTQLLCSDIDNDGEIIVTDVQKLRLCTNGRQKVGSFGPEVTGNWTNNPNYATEDGQFYTDIPITGMTANHSASIIVKGTYESGFFPKAECVEGAIRIYAKLCPIEALTAVVSWTIGDGTAVITTESEDLTVYDEHLSNAYIHVTADEKAVWNTKEVFLVTITSGEDNSGKIVYTADKTFSEIQTAVMSGKCVLCSYSGNNSLVPYLHIKQADIGLPKYLVFFYASSDLYCKITISDQDVVDVYSTFNRYFLPDSGMNIAGKTLMVNSFGYPEWTSISVPTKVSELQNDAGYLTQHQDISGKANASDLTAHTGNSTVHVTAEEKAAWSGKSNFSGSYNDLSDKPTIPTVPSNVSAFTNDVGYLTQHQDISGKIDKPASGVVGQVLAVKTVDENGKPTEFACVYQTSGGSSGSEGEVVETTFKVWGPNATGAADGDVVTELNSGYYDKSGNQVQTSTFGCTVPLIEINEDATIYAYNLYDFSAGYAITFFDSSKAVISGVGGTGNTSTRITGNQTVPSGAKYVAVTLLKSDPGMYCQITTRETVVTDSLGTQVGFLEADVATLKTQVSELTNEVDSASNETETFDYSALSSSITSGYYDTNGVFQSTTGWRCTNFIPVSEGDKLTVKLTTYNTTMAIAYFDENKEFISGVIGATWSWSTSVYPLSGEQVVPAGAYFVRISVFIADYATEQYVTINRATMKNIQHNLDIINGKPLNVLILGDSYSEMGRWVDGMKEVIDIKNLVNLGVSSATLKDKQANRTTYPYSSRPKTTTDSGNVNTLSSQIAWLKRLMAGTDLDSGEVQLYTDVADYPDVIIIEGGMNDAPDNENIVATYHDQFMTSKTAYYKLNNSSAATQTTVWVPTPLDTIDRTCFAGAYRYLCEELLVLFPKAQIFITTASHMNYFTVNPNVRYGEIAKQQRMCADIMSYTVIDWHAEGNLNTMMISLNGSGTESDPYTPVGGDEYTTDLLHPNDEGGKRYGRLAGKVIAQKFLNFN